MTHVKYKSDATKLWQHEGDEPVPAADPFASQPGDLFTLKEFHNPDDWDRAASTDTQVKVKEIFGNPPNSAIEYLISTHRIRLEGAFDYTDYLFLKLEGHPLPVSVHKSTSNTNLYYFHVLTTLEPDASRSYDLLRCFTFEITASLPQATQKGVALLEIINGLEANPLNEDGLIDKMNSQLELIQDEEDEGFVARWNCKPPNDS